jgi:hypothetical protein
MAIYDERMPILWKWLPRLSTRQWGVAFLIGLIPPILARAQGDLLTSDFVAGLLFFGLAVGAMVGSQSLSASEETDNKNRWAARYRLFRRRRRA